MWKESENEKTKTNRLIRIKKVKDQPSPGDYDVNSSFRKTQVMNPVFKIPEQEYVKFTDVIVKNKKFLPGVGTYKQDPEVFNKLS